MYINFLFGFLVESVRFNFVVRWVVSSAEVVRLKLEILSEEIENAGR